MELVGPTESFQDWPIVTNDSAPTVAIDARDVGPMPYRCRQQPAESYLGLPAQFHFQRPSRDREHTLSTSAAGGNGLVRHTN